MLCKGKPIFPLGNHTSTIFHMVSIYDEIYDITAGIFDDFTDLYKPDLYTFNETQKGSIYMFSNVPFEN